MLSVTKETFKLTQRQRIRGVFVSSFIRENYHFKIWSNLCFPNKKYHWKTKSVPEISKPKKVSRQKVSSKVIKEEKKYIFYCILYKKMKIILMFILFILK